MKASKVEKPAIFDENEEETLQTLNREQERLMEEFETEKRQCDNLKKLFSHDLNNTASLQKSSLASLKTVLQKSKGKDEHIMEAIRLLEEYEGQDSAFIPDTPRVSELASDAKDAEIQSKKLKKESSNLKKTLAQVGAENDELKKVISEAETQIKALTESKAELKTKLKDFVDNCKKRELSWKEKISALEAQLEAQA